mgnify:FL=1
MKIVEWGMYDSERYEDVLGEERALAENIIIQEMRENDYHFNGYYHQNGQHGTPIFDNGKQYHATLRGWGAIMARAYPNEIDDSDGMGYTEWAWDSVHHKEKYPE